MARRVTEMASATVENEQVVSESDAATSEPEDNKQTRERVDLSKLDANDKVTITFSAPAGLKRALNEAGEKDNKSGSTIALLYVAEKLGYTVPNSFIEHTRKRKYDSEEAKQNAQLEQRKKMAAVLAALEAGALDPAILEQFTPASLPTRKRKAKTEDAPATE